MPIIKKRRKIIISEIDEEEEITTLRERLENTAPPPGSHLTNLLKFEDFPLSSRTLQGLLKANLIIPTDIQAAALPHALCGRDILGAGKTGSGKTLCFILPILERLYLERWDLNDGLAAIIITPTRELALQIFEVLRIIGKKHQISAGLVTGGKKEFEEEQLRIIKMNILVATPGRLLQHFEQTPSFDASNLLLLVLDEADRILDMGFKQQLDCIMTYLPSTRQTLLFSATQTKSIKDLARLNLSKPEYIAVHAEQEDSTPSQLKQNYIVCLLHKKLDTLFSFLKTHLKSKLIVFLSTCSQVRFVFECFRGMQPGIPLTALHGKIKQERRTLIYMDFVRKKHACLFATDIAARGLDFPDVDWVVQVDAPEDAAMYIHRVGRTARYTAGGRGLLMLIPSEERSVTEELSQAGIPIKKLSMNPNKTVSVSNNAAALLVSNPECRSLAKKAFLSYLKSYLLLPRNKGLGLRDVDTTAFSSSLGLAIVPSLPQTEITINNTGESLDPTKKPKNVNRTLDKLKKQLKAAKEEKRLAREKVELERTGKSPRAIQKSSQDEEDEDELFVPKKSSHQIQLNNSEEEEDDDEPVITSVTGAKKKKAKSLKIGFDGESSASRRAGAKRLAFDDSGNTIDPLQKIAAMNNKNNSDTESDEENLEADISARVSAVRKIIDSGRKEDAMREKVRIKEKHLKEKQRLREEREESQGGVVSPAVLSNFVPQEEDDDDSEESDREDDDDSNNSSEDDHRSRKRKASNFQDESENDEEDSDNVKEDESEDNNSGSDEEDDNDLRAREVLALKLLAKKK